MPDLTAIESKTIRVKLMLATAVIVLVVLAWFSVRWQLGDMLATLTQATDPNFAEIAELATRWAPGDPAAFSLKASAGEDTDASIKALEAAVRRLRAIIGGGLIWAEPMSKAISLKRLKFS